MKLSRVFILTASVLLLLVSCRDGAQLNGPVGNYLYIAMDLPDTDDGQSLSRVIHPDSIFLTITLTYQNGQVIEGEADLDGLSDVTHTLDQLPTGQGVQLEVSLGLIDLPLCSSSVAVDINPGGNSADMTLAYSEYTVQGTLVDKASTPIPNQTVTIDGTTVTTDANGIFPFTISTEDWTDYSKLTVPVMEGEIYNFVRKKRDLIDSRSDFTLVAQGEVFVDLTISSELFPIEGAELYIDSEMGYTELSGTPLIADADGRITFTDTIDGDYGGADHYVSLSYKGVFVEQILLENGEGSPGALVGEIVMDPYVIFVSEYRTGYIDYLYQVDFDSNLTSAEGERSINSLSPGSYFTSSFSSYGAKSYVNYKTGQIYLFVSDDVDISLIRLDGFNDSSPVISSLSGTAMATYGYEYSVQQMFPIKNGLEIVAVSTVGAFSFNAETLAITETWVSQTPTMNIALMNGGYEDSDGSIYVMGDYYSFELPSTVNGVQRRWRLDSGTPNPVDVGALPSPYNNFDYSYSSNFKDSDYASMYGLFPWTDGTVMSVIGQSATGTETGGTILTLKDWGLQGSPVDNGYDYLIPVGILPDNKFYIVNDSSSSSKDKKVLRMDNPSDGTPDERTFLIDPSSGYRSMFYYFDPAGLVGPYT